MIKLVVSFFFALCSCCIFSQSSINFNSVKLYWDVSFSMEKRDVEKELKFLDTFFKQNDVKEVVVVTFSNRIRDTKEFTVVDKNLQPLKLFLSNLTYEGISDFSFLLSEDSDVPSVFFTDGHSRLQELKLHYGKSKMDIVCATGDCNAKLERLSLYSNGNYHMLVPERSKDNIGVKANMKDTSTMVLNGLVKDENGPVEDAAVIIQGKSKGTLTNKNGEFAIETEDTDTLVVKLLGKQTVEISVANVSNFVEINLEESLENLEEVVVVGNEKIKWLPKAKTLSYGGVQKIDNEDFTIIGSSVNESVVGKFSGVQTNKEGLSRAIIRGFSSITQNNYPLIIVDGAPMPRANSSLTTQINVDILKMVNPNDIVSVEVLKGLAAANRYGGEGSNGVIIIKTRYGTTAVSKGEGKEVYDRALLRDNNFTGSLIVEKDKLNRHYLKVLEQEETVSDSYKVYLEQRNSYINDPYYFIDVYNLFKVANAELARDILNSALENVTDDISILTIIAYYHQEAGRYKEALDIYTRILSLDGSKLQSYRNVANSNVQVGNLKDGLNWYLKILKPGFQPTLDIPSLKDIVTLELKNFVYRYGKDVNISMVSDKYKTEVRYDARVLLEWNDSNTEFEIEFISPDKKISKWSHSKKENSNRIQKELQKGFQIEEFLLSNAQKGDWYINVRTFANNERKPLFIKCVVQYYFGQAGQYETQEVFRFNNIDNERIITKIPIR